MAIILSIPIILISYQILQVINHKSPKKIDNSSNSVNNTINNAYESIDTINRTNPKIIAINNNHKLIPFDSIQTTKGNDSKKKTTSKITPKSIENEWLIIAGGYKNIGDSNQELKKALELNPNSSIIKKRNSYRIVLMGYENKIEAANQLKVVKEKINSTAYFVRKNTWCDSYQKTESCLICN